ncbi:O-antigen ligase family protein [Anaerotalea alkaliphila]|uniref:O-antigen ligase family protein n=1 Tax=Anaerotalea alkaliphila TaxID=2662126 RepID=A0A7X5HV84_9FIRM|nr:O-antigen ligase family protein [Anaerotalea alkaliphila]NDL67272.1 O-antigen ligase family protein [Anaerotalea alkaliphila]
MLRGKTLLDKLFQGKTLLALVVGLVPLFLFPTMTVLDFRNTLYVDMELHYGGKVLLLGVLVALLVYSAYREQTATGKWPLVDGVLLAFVGWTFLTALLSEHRLTGLFGWPWRWQGAFTHLLYLGVFTFAAHHGRGAAARGRLLDAAFLAGAVTALVVVAVYLGAPPLEVTVGGTDFKVGSPIGNRNFLGSYLCMLALAAMFRHLQDRSGSKRHFLLTVLLFAGLLVSQTRGAWLGFAAALPVMLFLLRGEWRRIRKGFLALLGSFLLVAVLLDWAGAGRLGSRIDNALDQVEMAQAGDVAQLGTSRLYIYQRSLEVFLANPVFGTGPDNLAHHIQVSEEDNETYFGGGVVAILDKAHSEYLEYAATLGLPGLLLYLWFAGRLVLGAIRRKDRLDPVQWGALAGAGGYLLQATFNIGTIGVLPVFYFLAGLLKKGGTEGMQGKEQTDQMLETPEDA